MTDQNATDFIYSAFANDPDLGDLVDTFVTELPNRVRSIRENFVQKDWTVLQRLSHQLKGAAGSYGFAFISPCAGRIEMAVRDQEPEEAILAKIEELAVLCGRVRPGTPPAN